jgi:iron complex transport system substrate-binding protein
LKQKLQDDPRWKTLTAVKNSRAHVVDKKLLQFKPNHRWAVAYETLEAYFFGQ